MALVQKEVKKVYLGTTQVRPAGGGGWQPGANTVAYYPLNDDLEDKITNTYMTAYSGATLTTFNGVKCLNLTASGSYTSNSTNNCATGHSDRTHLMRVYWTSIGNMAVYAYGTSGWGRGDALVGNKGDTGSVSGSAGYGINWSNYGMSLGTQEQLQNQWVFIAITAENYVVSIYQNGGSNVHSLTMSGHTQPEWGFNTASGTPLYFGKGPWDSTATPGKYLGEFISEDRAWTATEIQNYYDQTKGNYGL